ncbi:MAG: hypothetical protein J2P17_10385 [Mycobacterium sp.]|nr:hypothetical protein [Mycobacterium sp.]
MTTADGLLDAERSTAGKPHAAHREPSHYSFALCQIPATQPPFPYQRCADAFSREVPVNAA